jgi:hypothetical protein
MPKLNAKLASTVEKAEVSTGSFELIKPGRYPATLNGVEVKDGNHGMTQWSAEFGDIMDASGNRVPGRQWLNLNIPTDAPMPASYTNGADKWASYQSVSAARLKAFFEAFGYTVDSDTDEMIGERAVIDIEVRTIQNGPRRGEQVNGVKAVYPLPAGTASAATADTTF